MDTSAATGNESSPQVKPKQHPDPFLNPDPSFNPIFQKLVGRDLHRGGGVDMIMRNQLLNAYEAVENQELLLTTSEIRNKHDLEHEMVAAIEKAKVATIKAQLIDVKAENFKEELQLKVIQSPPSVIRHEYPVFQEPKTLVPKEPVVKSWKRKAKPKKLKDLPKVEENEIEKPILVEAEKDHKHFVSLWEKYANEGPPDVEVEVEASAPNPTKPPYISGTRRFNVMVQVRPKDITKVLIGRKPDADEASSKYKYITPTIKPKMMDVSTFVKPRKPGEAGYEPPFKNASTMARPRGYRELQLDIMEVVTYDKEVEVTELEIERSTAGSRGVALGDGNIQWPTIHDFTHEVAEIKIKTYIRNIWKLGTSWMYDVRFIQAHTTNYRKKFVFEVVFSTPTPKHPVPPATASVFFVFEAGHYNCPDNIMKVHYVLEGNRYPYTPGGLGFREEWLKSIIDDKLRIQKAINF